MKKTNILVSAVLIAFVFVSLGAAFSYAAVATKKPGVSTKKTKTAVKKTKKAVKKPAKKTTKKTVKAKSKKTAAAKKKTTAKISNTEGPVGTWLTNGHSQFRVLSADYAEANPNGERAPVGTRWFVVKVEIKNGDPFTATYGGDFHRVMVIDAKKVYYSENIAKRASNWAENDDKMELMPGEIMQTDYVFTMPNEADPVRILFDASSADKYPVIKVNL